MANFENFVPIFLNMETGVILKDNETNEDLFNRTKKEGYKSKMSVCGVNKETYSEYMVTYKGYTKTDNIPLIAISYQIWCDIFITDYWLPCKANLIDNQRIANFIVDWYFASGEGCIKLLNKYFFNKDDDEMTVTLIDKINSFDEKEIINILTEIRSKDLSSLNLTTKQKEHIIKRFKKI